MGKLQSFINKYNKELAGSIIKLSESPYRGVLRTSTGSFSLDIATGGGLPRSSIVEMFGEESTAKSLTCLKAIAATQKKLDKDCVYIDLEGALTMEWAEKVGVNPEKLFIARPKTAEKALDMAIDLVSTREVGIIVIDSVAALCPIVETEESLVKQQMGLAARLMSKTLRVLASTLQPESLNDKETYNPCTVIFINQTREKIGILFGCFTYDTKITTNKGQLKLGDIVTKNLICKILSKNKKGILEYKEIETSACTGETDRWLKIWTPIFKGCNSSSNRVLSTPNHEFITLDGVVQAKDLIIGDFIYKKYTQFNYSPIYNKLIGMVLGDSAIREANNKSGLASIRFSHGKKQLNYLKYKRELMNGGKLYTGKDNVTQFESERNTKFLELKKLRNNKLILNFDFNNIKLESLLYWYLDDGTYVLKDKTYKTKSIQIATFRGKKINEKLLKRIQQITGINSGYASNIRITLNVTMSNYLINKWARMYFIPKCMRYKFKDNMNFIKKQKIILKKENILIPLKIFNIEKVIKNRKKYNLTINDNHNYFANGILVGNSPLTTPGGKALKFYSDVRIHLKRGETIRDNSKNIIGQNVKFNIVKNKTYKPMQVGQFSFYYDGHIDNEASIVDYAIVFELIKQKGAWFYFKEEKFQGRERLITYLKEQPKVLLMLKKDIINILKKD